jgi:hypothetical protein
MLVTPSLIITSEQIDEIIALLRDELKSAQSQLLG